MERLRYNSPLEAREQAAEAQGFAASLEIKAGDEVFEVPQRGLMDDDQAERLAELELETETWDHAPDVTLSDGTVIPGGLKRPYRKNGKLVKPSYAVRVAIAVWGEEKYNRYKAAGGRAADVTAALAQLDRRLSDRVDADPKSVGHAGPDPVVAEGD